MEENKDQQLLDKVNTLCLLLEEETSPIARGIYAAQLDFLISTMQREIDIQTIMEEYGKKREDIKQSFDSTLPLITSNKERALNSMDRYSQELRKYSRYDPSSPKFAFKAELKSVNGSLSELLFKFTRQGKNDLASKIDIAATYRKKYEEALAELKQLEEEGDSLQKNFESEQNKNKQEETALIEQRRKKGNIFTRIFNAIKRGFKVAKGQPYGGSPEVTSIGEQIAEQNLKFEEELQSNSKKLNDMIETAEQQYNAQIQVLKKQFEQTKKSFEELYGKQEEKIRAHHEPIIEGFTKKKRDKFLESLGVSDTVQSWQDIHGNVDDSLENETESTVPKDVLEDEAETPSTDDSSNGKKHKEIDFSFLWDKDGDEKE